MSEAMGRQVEASYWDYLRLPQLLDLQRGFDAEERFHSADESHFIIVHQVFELWFKLIILEIRLARDALEPPRVPEDEIPGVVRHLRRAERILAHSIQQFDVMETLDPQDFIDFRERLVPASGFQSFQFRQIELLLGLGLNPPPVYEQAVLRHFERLAAQSESARAAWDRISEDRARPPLLAVVERWLQRTPIDGSVPTHARDQAVVEEFLADYLARYEVVQSRIAARSHPHYQHTALGALVADDVRSVAEYLRALNVTDPVERARIRRVRAALLFIECNRELPLLAWPRALIDCAMSLEERLIHWRARHTRLVERTIGRQSGTGGTQGVAYLEGTEGYRIFSDFWVVRSILLPRKEIPVLRNREYYFDLRLREDAEASGPGSDTGESLRA